MTLCKYKDALGIPKQGIHSFRIFNIAIADVLLTIVASYFISFISKSNFFYTLICLFFLGILLHRAFCVRTTIDELLFPQKYFV